MKTSSKAFTWGNLQKSPPPRDIEAMLDEDWLEDFKTKYNTINKYIKLLNSDEQTDEDDSQDNPVQQRLLPIYNIEQLQLIQCKPIH